MLGVAMLIPAATPALAKKYSYKQPKNKKYKVSRKFKTPKVKHVSPQKARHPAAKHR